MSTCRYACCILTHYITIILKYKLNLRENRRCNYEWTIQRNWQPWIHKTQDQVWKYPRRNRQRWIDNVMVKWRRMRKQTIVPNTLHRKLKIEKYEPSKTGASSIPVPLVVPVVLIFKRHNHHLIQNSRKQINIYLLTKAREQRRSEHLVTQKS